MLTYVNTINNVKIFQHRTALFILNNFKVLIIFYENIFLLAQGLLITACSKDNG
jgi:hypothetical protein